jgi:hypothetical protein
MLSLSIETQCTSIALDGQKQCPYPRLEGYEHCHLHALGSKKDADKQIARNYKLTRYRERVNQFADNSQIKSLREEIGLVRLIIEDIVNKCNDENDLLLYSGKISELIMKVNKLVVDCHRLEYATGNLLDKTTIINIANIMITAVGKYVNDGNHLAQISDEIMTCILETSVAKDQPHNIPNK